jgi:hypothetical protein
MELKVGLNILDAAQQILYVTTYIVATGGTIETTCGDYKTHIFTSDGCFAVSHQFQMVHLNNEVDYIVVAGGGGGSGIIILYQEVEVVELVVSERRFFRLVIQLLL